MADNCIFRKAELDSHPALNSNKNDQSSMSSVFADMTLSPNFHKDNHNTVKSPAVSPLHASQTVQKSPLETRDLTSTLMDTNLRQMHSQPSPAPGLTRMSSSMSMPMGMATMQPPQQPMMNTYFPSANNNMPVFNAGFGSNVPRSQTAFNLNAFGVPATSRMNMFPQPRPPVMNHKPPSDNSKMLSKQDIDDFLR